MGFLKETFSTSCETINEETRSHQICLKIMKSNVTIEGYLKFDELLT